MPSHTARGPPPPQPPSTHQTVASLPKVNGGRPWKQLVPIDYTSVTKSDAPEARISVWPSSSSPRTASSVFEHQADQHASVPGFVIALRARVRELSDVAEQVTAGGSAEGDSAADGESQHVLAALVRLDCCSDIIQSLKSAFRSYAPLFDDLARVIALARGDVLRLRDDAAALASSYQIAVDGVAKIVADSAASKQAGEREVSRLAAMNADLQRALEAPTVLRRDLQALERKVSTLTDKLATATTEAEQARIQSVTKSVQITHLEADREHSSEVIAALRREIEEHKAAYHKLRCDTEFVKIDADRYVADKNAQCVRLSEELAAYRGHLAEAQHVIAEYEEGVRASGTAATARKRGGIGMKITTVSGDPGFDWTRLCANKELNDLYELDEEGNRTRHLSDMTEAERIKHILGVWRRYRVQLTLADEFIALHGLRRDETLRQDTAAAVVPRDPNHSLLDISVAPAIAYIRNLARFEAAKAPPLFPALVKGHAPSSHTGVDEHAHALVASDRYFTPLETPQSVLTVAVLTPAPPSEVAAPLPIPGAAAPVYMAWPFPGPVLGIAMSVADAVDEVRDLFAFYRKCRASNPDVGLPSAVHLWLVSSKYTHDARRRVGFIYSLWYTVEQAATTSDAPVEFLLLIAMHLGEAPADFLQDFDRLVNDARIAFKRRAAKNPGLPRPALQSVLRRVVPWYDTDDFDILLNAADATLPYSSGPLYEEGALFSLDGPFLRTLCYQHLCQTLSFVRAMTAALNRITPTTAAAVAASRMLADGVVAAGAGLAKSDGRRRKSDVFMSLPPIPALSAATAPRGGGAPGGGPGARGAAAAPVPLGNTVANGVSMPPGTVAAANVEMILFGDVLKVLSSVDPDKPKPEMIAFLLRCLAWDPEPYAILLPQQPAAPESPFSSRAPERAPTSPLITNFDNDGDSGVVDVLPARAKAAKMSELCGKWVVKAALLAALGRVTERRVTSVPTWQVVRLTPTEVYGIRLAAAPQTQAAAAAGAKGAAKIGGGVGSRRK